MIEQDTVYTDRVAYILAEQITSAHPIAAKEINRVAETIKRGAEDRLKAKRRWTANLAELATLGLPQIR